MYIDDAISPEDLKKYTAQKGPEAMKAVAENMETLFTYELVKEMRATTMEGGQDYSRKTYEGMFDMELARLLAQKETGLRDMILKQIEQINSKVTHEEPSSDSLNSKGKQLQPITGGGPSISVVPATDGGPAVNSEPVTNGNLPYRPSAKGPMNDKTKSMIRAAFGGQAANAIAVVFAESSGNPSASHYNAPYGSTDYGLFQINDKFWAARLMKKGIINNVSDLFDPQKNIQAAAWIYKQGGWNLWTSVRSGKVQLGPPDVMEAENAPHGSVGSGSQDL